jgi:uncharacterized protein (TIGR03000 family)
MIRTLALLAALAAASPAFAQLIARPAPHVGRPAGVIQPPQLTIPGQGTPPNATLPPRVPPLFRPQFSNPFFGALGYGGYWPDYYDEPLVNNNVAPPTAPPTTIIINTVAAPPPPPPELRSRLALTVPFRSTVYLSGKEVDSNANPIILESPVLQEGQSYTFHVKVTWTEGQNVEERSRSVTVEAGEQKSLTYTR